MTPNERIAAMRRGDLTIEQCCAWAARYPNQVPLINGEFEFIAALHAGGLRMTRPTSARSTPRSASSSPAGELESARPLLRATRTPTTAATARRHARSASLRRLELPRLRRARRRLRRRARHRPHAALRHGAADRVRPRRAARIRPPTPAVDRTRAQSASLGERRRRHTRSRSELAPDEADVSSGRRRSTPTAA